MNSEYSQEKKHMKSFLKSLLSLAVLSAVLLLCVSADDVYSSKDDPLVSLSYVNDILGPEIMSEVLDKIDAEYVKKADVAVPPSAVYQLLTLDAGSTLMAKGICEIIIVSGDASAVVTSAANVSDGNGLIDTTDGTVITGDSDVPVNHYVVIPVADGRGITAETQVRILVRGEYNING